MITARDIMHTGAQCIEANQTLMEAAKMMASKGVGALPICGADKMLKGIITDRDIVVECLAKGKDPSTMKAMDMASHLHCVRADDSMETVLHKMQQHQIRRMPVIDENKKLVGMISESDLAKGHTMANGLTDAQIAKFMDDIYAKR